MQRSGVYPLMAVLTICLAPPLSAQERDLPSGGLARNDAECHAQFNRLDRNGDGVLSRAEVSTRRDLIPPRLTAEGGSITRQNFLAACSDGVRPTESGG